MDAAFSVVSTFRRNLCLIRGVNSDEGALPEEGRVNLTISSGQQSPAGGQQNTGNPTPVSEPPIGGPSIT